MSTETENSKEQPGATQNQENTTPEVPSSAPTTETPAEPQTETHATSTAEEDLAPMSLMRDRQGVYSLNRHGLVTLCPFRVERTFTTPSIDPATNRPRKDKQGNTLDNLYKHPVRCDSLCPKFGIKKIEGDYAVTTNCGSHCGDTYIIPEKNYTEYKKPSAIISPTDEEVAAVDPILRTIKPNA